MSNRELNFLLLLNNSYFNGNGHENAIILCNLNDKKERC